MNVRKKIWVSFMLFIIFSSISLLSFCSSFMEGTNALEPSFTTDFTIEHEEGYNSERPIFFFMNNNNETIVVTQIYGDSAHVRIKQFSTTGSHLSSKILGQGMLFTAANAFLEDDGSVWVCGTFLSSNTVKIKTYHVNMQTQEFTEFTIDKGSMNLSVSMFQRIGFNRFLVYFEGLSFDFYNRVGAQLIEDNKHVQLSQEIMYLNLNGVSYEFLESISMQDGGAIATIKAEYSNFYQIEQYWLGGRSQNMERVRVMLEQGVSSFSTWNNSIYGGALDTKFDEYITMFALKSGAKYDVVVMSINPNHQNTILFRRTVHEIHFGEMDSNALGQNAMVFWFKDEIGSTPMFSCIWHDSMANITRNILLESDSLRLPGIEWVTISEDGALAIMLSEFHQSEIKTRFKLFFSEKPSIATNEWTRVVRDADGVLICRSLSFRAGGALFVGLIDGNSTRTYLFSRTNEMIFNFNVGDSSKPEFYSAYPCTSDYTLLIGAIYQSVDPLDTDAKLIILNPSGALYHSHSYSAGGNETYFFGHSFENSVVLFGRKKVTETKYYSVIRKLSFDTPMNRIVGDYDGISYLRPVRPILVESNNLTYRYSDLVSYAEYTYMSNTFMVEAIKGVIINASLYSKNVTGGIALKNYDLNMNVHVVIENVEITGLKSDSANSSGIFLHRIFSAIKSVYVHDNEGSGIIIFAGMHFSIQNSIIEKNAHGIKVSRVGNEAARHKIEQCKIVSNRMHGIFLTKEVFKDNYGEWAGVYDLDVYNNEVNSNGGWGLILEKGGRNNIKNNKFCQNGEGGIAYTPFEENTFENNECGEFTLKGLYAVFPEAISIIIALIVASLVIPVVIKKIKSRSKIPKSIKNTGGAGSVGMKSEDSDFEFELN